MVDADKTSSDAPQDETQALAVDAARGLALVGLTAVHFLPQSYPDNDRPTLSWLLFAGDSAALFALLAWQPQLAGHGTVQTRLVMWRAPWTNALPNGSQLGEGLWALAAGHGSGQGLAHHLVPIVPAGKTDLVLATLTEQLGARGLVAYDLLLAALVFGALHVAARGRTAERTLKTWITRKEQEGAEAIVLACTELALVVDVDANVLPVFDSTRIHAAAAVDFILGDTPS